MAAHSREQGGSYGFAPPILALPFWSQPPGRTGTCQVCGRSIWQAPDKTQLAAVRILNILALAYLLLSSPALRALAGRRFFRPLEACGRHSLEVFAVGCICSLFGRLLFLTYGAGLEMQIAINVVGLATMFLVGLWLARRRVVSRAA